MTNAISDASTMRAPSAATALYALESAMDELAAQLGLDPLELRLRCYSERDQHAPSLVEPASLAGLEGFLHGVPATAGG